MARRITQKQGMSPAVKAAVITSAASLLIALLKIFFD